jgi:hypothetical protein
MFRTKACIMFMPPLCRLPPCLYSSSHQDLSQTYTHSLVLTATFSISTLHRGFTCVHLHNTYLTVLDGLFPRSLTTTALYSSRIGWFGSSFWSLKPRGLLSSLIQHERLSPFFMTHEQSGTNFPCELALFISFFNSCKPHEKIYEISINNANIIKPLIK